MRRYFVFGDNYICAGAAFRTALISPLLTGEIPTGQREAYMQSIASEERLFPNGQRARVSVRTLWRWVHRMRKGGFEGILNQKRSDSGKPRRSNQARVIRAVELKRGNFSAAGLQRISALGFRTCLGGVWHDSGGARLV